jgi:hypothetical protein
MLEQVMRADISNAGEARQGIEGRPTSGGREEGSPAETVDRSGVLDKAVGGPSDRN